MANHQTKGTWLLTGIPAYKGGGRLCDAVYPCGSLICELGTEQPAEAQMQIVTDATLRDYSGYLALLQKEGYTLLRERAVEKNSFACLAGVGKRVYVSYFKNDRRLTVTEDHTPYTAEDVSYTEGGTGYGEFFVYGLNMDPGGYHAKKQFAHLNTSGYPNCGMLLAMTCGDGSVVVVDGGYSWQFPNGALAEVDHFLHRIAGKGEEEKVRIAAWYMTHNHPDHYQGFADLLKNYPERYELERIIANLYSTEAYPKHPPVGLTTLAQTVREQYPDCREVKVHTGDVIRLADATLEVLYTHEDAVDGETGLKRVKDFNDTSTVIKVTIGGEEGLTAMVLGDISLIAEERLVKMYTKKTMKCDIAQEAHHNFNYITELYRLIAAPIMCFVQTEQGTLKNEATQRNAEAAMAYSKKAYYNGDITKTIGFGKKDGKVRQVYRYLSYIE